ncbi:MAG: type IX secretion system outer membrane channel protein PorV [Bacteroidetes bacterium]|nr:type IX secretion system outer membrane channel protein PorV [Bacteroidota bacterium]
MNTTKKVLGIIGSGLFLVNGVTAQVTTTSQLTGGINTITTAVPFLMICPDSRQGGMGEVGAATTPDANSIHWNGSKLVFAEKKSGVAISYTPWLRQLVPDINLAYISGYSKVSKNTAVGASLRYFSLGNITFTDIVGNTTGQFRPNEFAIDLSLSQKLSQTLSMGLAMRYIYSNLTGNYTLSNGQATRPGKAVAADVSLYYQSKKFEIDGKKSVFSAGLAITNIGQKMSYSVRKDFIPINMRLGAGLKMNMDEYNQFGIYADANKLLVPTPPVYQHVVDSTGRQTAEIAIDPATGAPVIAAGKDPNVSVAKGMVQSFSDAPGGGKEELREINYSIGIEYWYAKQFAVRAGYFHEDKTKGNRKFFTVGAGVRYNVFGLDLAYLIPTTQRNPLQNTLRFTLSFDFDAFKDQNKDTPKAD